MTHTRITVASLATALFLTAMGGVNGPSHVTGLSLRPCDVLPSLPGCSVDDDAGIPRDVDLGVCTVLNASSANFRASCRKNDANVTVSATYLQSGGKVTVSGSAPGIGQVSITGTGEAGGTLESFTFRGSAQGVRISGTGEFSENSITINAGGYGTFRATFEKSDDSGTDAPRPRPPARPPMAPPPAAPRPSTPRPPAEPRPRVTPPANTPRPPAARPPAPAPRRADSAIPRFEECGPRPTEQCSDGTAKIFMCRQGEWTGRCPVANACGDGRCSAGEARMICGRCMTSEGGFGCQSDCRRACAQDCR